MKSIVVWDLPNHPWMSIPFLRRLKVAHNAKIHFVCGDLPGLEYWKTQNGSGVIDTFTAVNHFFFEYDNAGASPEKIYEKARYYEDRYKAFAVDLLQADRHLGRGFFQGGINHPRSRMSDKSTYEKSVNMFNTILEFWQGFFDRTRPGLIIGVAGGIIGKGWGVVARNNKIPVRILVSSRYKSYYHWAKDEYYTCPAIKKNFDSINDPEKIISGIDNTGEICHPGVSTVYGNFNKLRSVRVLLKRIIKKSVNHCTRRYKRLVSMGNYRLSEEIGYLCRCHRGLRRMDNMNLLNAGDLKGLSYVFLPLHVEPETALGVFSPEFNEQLAMVELLAKNMPAGIFLAVKEHLLAVGRRPRGFYETIQEIPNVVMVSPRENAFGLAKGARFVAVITSSLGAEAAIAGIPVVSFGIHNNFSFLPHVYTVESWAELRPLLKRLCLAKDTKEEMQTRRRDGHRYLAALKASSVDLSWLDYSSKKRLPAGDKEAEVLYSSLMESIEDEGADEGSSRYHPGADDIVQVSGQDAGAAGRGAAR